jgi:hypothetical protein
MQFRKDSGDIVEAAIPGNKPVFAGHFIGTFNRSVTVVGIAEMQNEYINRDILGRTKTKEYKRMKMRHFQEDVKHPSGMSCATAILHAANTNYTTSLMHSGEIVLGFLVR